MMKPFDNPDSPLRIGTTAIESMHNVDRIDDYYPPHQDIMETFQTHTR